ncbi:microtubule-actin cross-linking factor 1, isoforms 6/7-like [Pocillopora verrucosa]|uniref:microtubule-actin cross-linking factor 1, isoforms 6/7-like n=1 Tax=Pocillopora verrucosa TaxID=203993 RepID=UPI003340F057
MERLRRLQEKLERIAIRRASAKFDFNEWKSRFNKWLRDSKSRVLDIFRRMDQDRDGKLTRRAVYLRSAQHKFPNREMGDGNSRAVNLNVMD